MPITIPSSNPNSKQVKRVTKNGTTSIPRQINRIIRDPYMLQPNCELRFTLHVSAAARNSTINIIAVIITAANVAFGINRKDCVR